MPVRGGVRTSHSEPGWIAALGVPYPPTKQKNPRKAFWSRPSWESAHCEPIIETLRLHDPGRRRCHGRHVSTKILFVGAGALVWAPA